MQYLFEFGAILACLTDEFIKSIHGSLQFGLQYLEDVVLMDL